MTQKKVPFPNMEEPSRVNEAIVLAGGQGTRLREAVPDLPKSMAEINGRPFLEYLLDRLIEQGIIRVVLSVGYLRDAIISHFGERYKDLEIDYVIEEEPMGTGGGIRLAMWKIKGMHTFALNGDSLFDVNLAAMNEVHQKHQADITLALRRLNDTGRFGRVAINKDQRIIAFEEKSPDAGSCYVNGGIYLINKLFLMEPEFRGKFSIEKECFEPLVDSARFFGFPSKGYFIDIGIPEDYQKAKQDLQNL